MIFLFLMNIVNKFNKLLFSYLTIQVNFSYFNKFHEIISKNRRLDISGFGDGLHLLLFKREGRIIGFEKIIKR